MVDDFSSNTLGLLLSVLSALFNDKPVGYFCDIVGTAVNAITTKGNFTPEESYLYAYEVAISIGNNDTTEIYLSDLRYGNVDKGYSVGDKSIDMIEVKAEYFGYSDTYIEKEQNSFIYQYDHINDFRFENAKLVYNEVN